MTIVHWFHLHNGQITPLANTPNELPEEGFYWADTQASEPKVWLKTIEQLLDHPIDELHLDDLANTHHPSHFDATEHYNLLIIRALSSTKLFDNNQHLRIKTRPTFFLLADKLLLTCHAPESKTFQALHHFIQAKTANERYTVSEQFLKFKKTPKTADEMLIQIISGLIDRYLETRSEISEKLDRWQRDLLNPKRRFDNWEALLLARTELNRLEAVAEDQIDALRDWVDHRNKKNKSDQTVHLKARDALEHLERMTNLARRLGESTEAAVQLHFSATAHKTSEIITLLTVLSAIFMPLTLFTGLFGMNFDHMPLLKTPHGFWIAIALMLGSSIGLVLLIWKIRTRGAPTILEDPYKRP